MDRNSSYQKCTLCPRKCGVNRYEQTGFCKTGAVVTVARAALHQWEEPCISGIHGSGTVFFSGCTLRCCYCQNYQISNEGFGKEITVRRLSEIFLELQQKGAHNLNLVTATQFLPSVTEALDLVKSDLNIPVVYNCGGYETPETIKALSNYIDIWLPDLKYFNALLSQRYSGTEDYFETASEAVTMMVKLTGKLVFEDFQEQGKNCQLLKKGVIIRHMVLPGHKEDSIFLLHWIKDRLPKGNYLLSLLRQYTPFYKSSQYPEINRRITTYEYEKVLKTAIELDLTEGYRQEKSSAKEEYTPSFELEGI